MGHFSQEGMHAAEDIYLFRGVGEAVILEIGVWVAEELVGERKRKQNIINNEGKDQVRQPEAAFASPAGPTA